ncbi:MAG: cytochrome c biogenesis CcdA family protein [Acidimicrobiales bacterium]
MGGAPLALAFAAGMLATVNPCGFAMLPAYLSYFVGLEDDPSAAGADRTVLRSVAVSAVMTLGFVVVFGVMGVLIVQVSSRVQEHLPWVTIVIGLALIGIGIAALFGRSLTVRLPKLQKGTGSRELPSMFLFGVSYALSSLSCTIAPFLAVTSTTFTNDGALAGTLTFVTYGLGMGAIVGLLTLAVALARNGVVTRFRRLLRHVNTISGVFMLVAGAYMAYYGWYELRIRNGPVDDPIVDRALAVQSSLTDLVDRIGTGRLGVIAGVVVGAALLSVTGWRLLRRHPIDHVERS